MPVSFQGIRSATSIQVPQGGTGLSTIPAGEILIGNDGDSIATIPVGSEGQVLTVVNGEWAAANNAGGNGGGSGGLSTVNTSGNIQGDGSAGNPVTLKTNISLTSVSASFKGDGSQITGLVAAQVSGIISSVSSSGNIQGNGTSGSPIILKDNISLSSVTASFNGSGAALTNLTASQIGGLEAVIDSRITNIPNSALQNSAITINGSSISLGGSVTIADTSVMTFTGSGFSIGDIVAMSGSLVKADYSDSMKSNVIGAVSAIDGTNITVKLFGEVTASGASLISGIGTPVYIGASGAVIQYSSITSGKYITQVGYISPTSGKIVLQSRVFGQMA